MYQISCKLYENSEDPDHTPRFVASDLGLHCLYILRGNRNYTLDFKLNWRKYLSVNSKLVSSLKVMTPSSKLYFLDLMVLVNVYVSMSTFNTWVNFWVFEFSFIF